MACVVASESTRRVDAAREPEVGDEDAAVARAQHVVRLEVAMDEAGGVRGGEPAPGGDERGDDRVGRAAAARSQSASVSPSTSSIATKSRPLAVPTSCTATTLGCVSRAIARASRSSRCARLGVGGAARSTLSATRRSRSGSYAA